MACRGLDHVRDQDVCIPQAPDELAQIARRVVERCHSVLAERRSEHAECCAQSAQADTQLVRPLDNRAFGDDRHVVGDLAETVAKDIARNRLDRRLGVDRQRAGIPCAGLGRRLAAGEAIPLCGLVERGEAHRPLVEEEAGQRVEQFDRAGFEFEFRFPDWCRCLAGPNFALVECEFDLAAIGRA